MRCALIILVLLLLPARAPASEFDSANYLLPKCKLLLSDKSAGTESGICMGVMLTFKSTGAFLANDVRVCVPEDATLRQMIRVVVKYIEERPEKMHVPFVALALLALRDAWPCRG
jgi:hypothetical protein